MTNDVARRTFEHRSGEGSAFTRRYGVHRLVYAEAHGDVEMAIAREKRIKRWRRAWKIELIEQENPDWCDVSDDLMK